MSKISDRSYLLHTQYKNAANLNARAALHHRFSTNKYGWLRWVFDRIQSPAGGRILEIGCGPAYLWRENLDRLPVDWEITLSDFSPGMLKAAQQNLKNHEQCFNFEIN